MSYKCSCRIPEKASGRYPEGSCPELLQDLMDALSSAEKLQIAFYLFNNRIFFDHIMGLAKAGAEVDIVSLPLDAYRDKPVTVNGVEGKWSKRGEAEKVYGMAEKAKNVRLMIYPHMYYWYGAKYAGGNPSYSFHVKAIRSVQEGGMTRNIVSSGNLAVCDPPHSENILVAENEREVDRVFEAFFDDLIERSISIEDYKTEYTDPDANFMFIGGKDVKDLERKHLEKAFFTAPFYKVGGQGSNHYASKRIIDLIKNAKERILLCAQHFHDLQSFDPNATTIFSAIEEKKRDNPEIEVKLLKQVPHSSLADKRRAALAESFFKYRLDAPQRFNRMVHDKFILVDDRLACISSSNYTPTQFAWSENWKMTLKDGEETYEKTDTFSEVNAFIMLDGESEVVGEYETHFNRLWEGGQDIQIPL